MGTTDPSPARASAAASGPLLMGSTEDQQRDKATQEFVEACLATPLRELLANDPGLESVFGETPCNVDVTKDRVICVRHAISCANYAQTAARLPRFSNADDEPWEEQSARVTLAVGSARALVDCPLHPLGVEQTEKYQAQKLHKFSFHTVLVSPLRRTLQTCNSLFRAHPARDNIRFLVFPHVREWIRYTDGIPCRWERLKYLFAKGNGQCDLEFDWSYMEKFVAEQVRVGRVSEDNWIIPSIANPEKQQRLEKKITDLESSVTVAAAAGGSISNGSSEVDAGGGTSTSTSSPAPLLYNITKDDAVKAGASAGKTIVQQTTSNSSSMTRITDAVMTSSPVSDALLSETRAVIPEPFEDYFDVMRRAEITRDYLLELRKQVDGDASGANHRWSIPPMFIGVVSHYRFLDAFFALKNKLEAEKAGKKPKVNVQKSNLTGGKSFANCEIAGWSF
eukprot:g16670.t1